MDIPAPIPLGLSSTTALLAGPGLAARVEVVQAAGRAPVILHELGGEKERVQTGPRELLERTRQQLTGVKEVTRWGAGAVVRSPEEAAQFATAGFTWFRLELARAVQWRADTMSLEELDAAIVALEDAGGYAPEWHAAYLDREFAVAPEITVRIGDEALARAAVKFAPVLTAALEIDVVLRNCWSGRGEPPDLEVAIAPGGPLTTTEEMVFLHRELQQRLSTVTAMAPALGHDWEPGEQDPAAWDGGPEALPRLAAAVHPIKLSLPSPLGAQLAEGTIFHRDETEDGRLAILRRLTEQAPGLFRDWVEAARNCFPIARHGWPLSLAEEDARFLPQVEDGELAGTFLDLKAGRQLLLSTWEDLAASELGTRARGLLG